MSQWVRRRRRVREDETRPARRLAAPLSGPPAPVVPCAAGPASRTPPSGGRAMGGAGAGGQAALEQRGWAYSIRVSFLEIYNEATRDPCAAAAAAVGAIRAHCVSVSAGRRRRRRLSAQSRGRNWPPAGGSGRQRAGVAAGCRWRRPPAARKPASGSAAASGAAARKRRGGGREGAIHPAAPAVYLYLAIARTPTVLCDSTRRGGDSTLPHCPTQCL